MTDTPSLTIGARLPVRAELSIKAIQRYDGAICAAADDDASISILDPIGADFWGEGVTAKRIEAALRRIGGRAATVKINSPGGDVFEGGAIYELLRQHSRDRGPVTVQIMGLAASAASVIAMAGDEIQIGQSGFIMIHNAWVLAAGDRNTFYDLAEWLKPFDEAMANVYAARTGQDFEDLQAKMNSETWITAKRAIEMGFADSYLAGDAISRSGEDDAAVAKIRAEKQFDLIAAKAGITRKDARNLRRDLKGGLPGAAATGLPEAADVEAGVAEILAELKS